MVVEGEIITLPELSGINLRLKAETVKGLNGTVGGPTDIEGCDGL